jgi:hypothetical protein
MDDEAYLCHRRSGTFVNLTDTSNGWFRFIPCEGNKHRICWSAGSVNSQDLPSGSADTIASLKAGGGMAVPKTFDFGCWSLREEGQLKIVRNKDSSSGCLYLTSSGFVYLPSLELESDVALIVENGREVIGTLEQGREALQGASGKADLKVTSSFHAQMDTILSPNRVTDIAIITYANLR